MAVLIYQKHNLTLTDVTSKLSVPARILNDFPRFREGEHYQRIIFKDMEETGIQWSFRLAVRRDGYKKPVISGRSWLHFVQRKGLQRGDGVMFFREDNEATGAVSYWVKPFYGRL